MAEVSYDSKLLQQSRSGMVTSSILSHSLSGPGQTKNCSSQNSPQMIQILQRNGTRVVQHLESREYKVEIPHSQNASRDIVQTHPLLLLLLAAKDSRSSEIKPFSSTRLVHFSGEDPLILGVPHPS
jgi:hypothetical protein